MWSLAHITNTNFYLVSVFLLSFVAAKPQPSALPVPIRADFYGNDGQWSPVSIRVGTPPQWVNLFVSTAGQETWVIGDFGCDGTQQCLTQRGGVFQKNRSSSWKDQGLYFLGLDQNLGFGGRGNYGLDSIALNDKVSVPGQIISTINVTDYWLGFFGLGVKPTNLTGTDQKPFLGSIVEKQGLVPSHSYGYTAGAKYRLKGVPGSLTLGGVDTTRFQRDNEVSFDLDVDQNPTIAINQITAMASPPSGAAAGPGWTNNSKDLVLPGQAALFTIDSSTPFLWFPEKICNQIEKALNLTYNDTLELYTFRNGSTQRDKLVSWNISFEMTLADLPDSSKNIKLTLPYSAFDLQLTFPYPNLGIGQNDPGVNYFPLRKAANNTQYTIGRSFLQEVYMTVDYERKNFSLHPAVFSIDPLSNAKYVNIDRPADSTFAGYAQGSPAILSGGAVAGIVFAAIFGVGVLIGVGVLLYRIRRDRPTRGYVKEVDHFSRRPSSAKSRFGNFFFRSPPRPPSSTFSREQKGVPELQGKETGSPTSELGSDVHGTDRNIREFYEREDVSPKAPPFVVVNAIGHDPSVPVELPYRSSNYRTSRRLGTVQELPPMPDHQLVPELPSPATVKGPLSATRSFNKSSFVSSPSMDSPTAHGSEPGHMVSPISPDEGDADGDEEVSSLETIARRAAWYVSNETPSVSSESRATSPRQLRAPVSIDGLAGFPTKHSRQNTVSSMDRSTNFSVPSTQNSVSVRGSPGSWNKVPRNSRATTALYRAESVTTSGESDTSTVTNVIRRSVQRGFNWLQPQAGNENMGRTNQIDIATIGPEQSPYSPARWIEFWKTGRDPRLGPLGERRESSEA